MLWIKTQQVCATCVLWEGEREESYSFVDALCENAPCSLHPNLDAREDAVCPQWTQVCIKLDLP